MQAPMKRAVAGPVPIVLLAGGPNYSLPGHIAAVHTVGLEHPRDATSPEFNDIKRRLLRAIHDEELS